MTLGARAQALGKQADAGIEHLPGSGGWRIMPPIARHPQPCVLA